MKVLVSIFLLIFLCSFADEIMDPAIAKEFDKWNKETLRSISTHERLETDPKTKSFWTHDAYLMNNFLYSPTYGDRKRSIKEPPLRYKFLDMIRQKILIGKHFYVLENEDSGEVITLNMYLIEDEPNNSKLITLYHFNNYNWEKFIDTTLNDLDISKQIQNTHLERKGFTTNWCDVILSEFDGRKIKCNYFLPITITKENPLNRILNVDIDYHY